MTLKDEKFPCMPYTVQFNIHRCQFYVSLSTVNLFSLVIVKKCFQHLQLFSLYPWYQISLHCWLKNTSKNLNYLFVCVFIKTVWKVLALYKPCINEIRINVACPKAGHVKNCFLLKVFWIYQGQNMSCMEFESMTV